MKDAKGSQTLRLLFKSSFFSISIVVNGYYDKNESYTTEIVKNSRNPNYSDCIQISVCKYMISIELKLLSNQIFFLIIAKKKIYFKF